MFEHFYNVKLFTTGLHICDVNHAIDDSVWCYNNEYHYFL